MTTYGTSSTSRASVSELSPRERSPALKSPLQSVVVRRRSPRPSPLQKSSPPLSNPSQMSSALQSSGTSFQAGSHQSPFDHGSAGLSPTRKSPVCKSPTPISSIYNTSQKEETTAPGGGAFSKRQVTRFVVLRYFLTSQLACVGALGEHCKGSQCVCRLQLERGPSVCRVPC